MSLLLSFEQLLPVGEYVVRLNDFRTEPMTGEFGQWEKVTLDFEVIKPEFNAGHILSFCASSKTYHPNNRLRKLFEKLYKGHLPKNLEIADLLLKEFIVEIDHSILNNDIIVEDIVNVKFN